MGKLCCPFLFYDMQNNFKTQKLILFSIFLLILFSYPLISIVNRPLLFEGIPVLFLYIFFVWISAIAFLYHLAESKSNKTDES